MTTTSEPPATDRRDLPIFPNYTLMDRRVPVRSWRRIRLVVFLAALVEIGLLLAVPTVGLDLFYGVAVPVLPALWLVAPGIWRNLCPLAAANQTPRLFGFSKGITAPAWVGEYGFLIAITLFLALASSRKWVLGDSGPATAAVLLAALSAAFLGGRYLKGKSGWCSTLCPLLPVQRLYGQNAFIASPNSHCEPCLGCAKNCMDFNPHVAQLADVYDDDRTYQLRRRLFAAAFPGFVLGFYLVPDPPAIGVGRLYLEMGLWVLLSIGVFVLLDSVPRLRPGRMTTVAAATAFCLYYWFTAQATADRFGLDVPAVVWAVRGAAITLAVVWLVRTFRKEGLFVEVAVAGTPARAAGPTATVARAPSGGAPPGDEVVFSHPDLPDVVRIVPEGEPSLLELAESHDLPIEAGCRLGVCGADPVAVLSGAEHLSPIGTDEQATLDRLGHAGNTRMACVSRVRGGCEVSLVPGAGELTPAGPPPFEVAAGIESVVVVGTGVAGVTAADHIRRFHPDCQISLVGREPHLLYNRMGISRVIYGRSAMSGLQLQDERWYDDRGLRCWLNTEVLGIDREHRLVQLGTGEALAYDRLIMATGADGRVPDVPGVEGPGTFVLRTADDAVAIRAWAQRRSCSQAVVAGGGLLGLEAAHALTKVHVDVVVLERGPHLLRRQLDARAATLLQAYLANLGVRVITDAELATVERDGEEVVLRLRDGREMPIGMLVLAAGIVPTTGLARDAGLEVDHGIVVDDRMQTSDPRIFAAGDCAQPPSGPTGLWPPAARQAEVAARNCLGDDQRFVPQPSLTLLKVAGIDLASVGRVTPADGDTTVVEEDPSRGAYRSLVIDAEGRAAGAILLGHPKDAPVVAAAIEQRRDLSAALPRLRQGDWSPVVELATAPA